MKRPFAVTGFTMLSASLLLYRMNLKETVVALCAAAVSFCVFMLFKKLRKDKRALTALFAFMIFGTSLLCSEYRYIEARETLSAGGEITARVVGTQSDDYTTSYVLKVESVNGKKQSFKIKFIEKEDESFVRGERVAGKVKLGDDAKYPDLFYNNLAGEVYFTVFESGENELYKIRDASGFYKIIDSIKNHFINTTRKYLPGENGKIANAMVIGERSELDSKTVDTFNYSGTSHLLVVSGLHLTIWSLGIMEIMDKFTRFRKFIMPVGILSLLFYASLTGFSVSVIRAGAMISGVLLGKAFHRGSDGLNSVGFALTFILLFNPFASYSAALWLSVMSTTGLLMCSGNVKSFIMRTAPFRYFSNIGLTGKIADALSVSIAVTVFTLPVFIGKFGLLPIASFLANFFMVPAGLLLMVLTVAGMVLDFVGIKFLASGVYFAVGLIAEFMRNFAEKIGMADRSTVSVSHRYFKYFLIAAAVILLISFIIKHFGKDILKPTAVFLLLLFVLTCLYCTSYERNTPSVDVISSGNTVSLLINSAGESVFIGGDVEAYTLKKEMNRHNAKKLGAAVITDGNPVSAERLKASIPAEKTADCADLKSVTVGGTVKADVSHYESYIVLTCGDKSLLIIMPEAYENPFENSQKYDIIIAYGADCEKYGGRASEIYEMSDGESIDIYWENSNGAYLRSRA